MIQETINYLGRNCRDRVTGFAGVIESVSFDLYGCVVVAVKPSVDNEGKPREAFWVDVQRIELVGVDRVMPVPAAYAPTSAARPATHDHGPAPKPRARA